MREQTAPNTPTRDSPSHTRVFYNHRDRVRGGLPTFFVPASFSSFYSSIYLFPAALLFYSSLSSLTLIIFLPFENLASLPLLFSLSASLPLSRVCCCLIPIADLARSLSFVVVVVFFLVVCVCVFWLLWIFWLSAVVQSLWFWLVPDRSSWIVGGGPISVVRWLVE